MFSGIEHWWRELLFSFHAKIVGWRYHNGRSRVFSDRPDWFVEGAAELFNEARTRGDINVVRLLRQAVDEWALRKRRGVQSYCGTKEGEQ